MQGVKQRPKAAPITAGEPLRRAGSSAGASARSSAGTGSRPSSANPIATTRMPEAIVSSSRWPCSADAEQAGGDAEHHEDAARSRARTGSPPRSGATPGSRAPAAGNAARQRREVAGDERQHARRREAQDPRRRRRARRGSLEAGELVVELRLERGAPGRVARRDRRGLSPPLGRRGASDARARPPAARRRSPRRSGAIQATRPKPERGGAASTCGPNCATSALLTRAFDQPAACARREVGAHAVGRRRRRDVEPLALAGRAHQLGLDADDASSSASRRGSQARATASARARRAGSVAARGSLRDGAASSALSSVSALASWSTSRW